MAATLSVDGETQLKALVKKMGLMVDEVNTIEDLTKVKREKENSKENKLFLWR